MGSLRERVVHGASAQLQREGAKQQVGTRAGVRASAPGAATVRDRLAVGMRRD